MTSLSKAAHYYRECGYSVLPTYPYNSGKMAKRPCVGEWKRFQSEIPDKETVENWFSQNGRALAVITGRVSGNLEAIDFDCDRRALAGWSSKVEEHVPGLLKRLVVEYSPHGAHVFYRCEQPVPGNQDLAFASIQVDGPGEHEYLGKKFAAREKDSRHFITPKMVETRGEGAYCITYPSEGYTPKQRHLGVVPKITAKERDVLIRAARDCNEWMEQKTEPPPIRGYHPSQAAGEMLPGADFDARGDVREILRAHGWIPNGTDKDGREFYLRPGKTVTKGAKSASLMDGRAFHVFTESAVPLEKGRTYFPFALFAALEHKGDYREAARALAKKGYGSGPTKNMAERRKSRGLTLGDLEKKFSQKVEWHFKTHIPKGMPSIWNGREKIGKSSLCLIGGREILKETSEGSVVWLATEGAVLDTVHKMQRFGLDSPRFVVAQKSDEGFRYSLNQERDLKELDDLLTELPQPILAVFIDSIRGMQPFGDNDDKIGGIMHRVNGIVCDKHGAALVYIDHWGKTAKGDLLDRNVGTTSKTAAVRHIVSILRQSAHTRKMVVASSNVINHESIPPLIAYESENDIVISEQPGAADNTLQEKCEAWMIDVFTKNAEVPAADMYTEGERRGFRDSLLREIKSRLRIQHVTRNRRSYWVSPYTPDSGDSNDSNTVESSNIKGLETVGGVGRGKNIDKRTDSVGTVGGVGGVDLNNITDSCVDTSIDRPFGGFSSPSIKADEEEVVI